jgi:hypothetical protein
LLISLIELGDSIRSKKLKKIDKEFLIGSDLFANNQMWYFFHKIC